MLVFSAMIAAFITLVMICVTSAPDVDQPATGDLVDVNKVLDRYRDGGRCFPGDDNYGSHVGMKPARAWLLAILEALIAEAME